MTDTQRERWEELSQWPLVGISLGFLAGWSIPIIHPDLADPWPTVCTWVVNASWLVFAVDYAVRLALADARTDFVRHSLVDLASVVAPVLRPLRLLRLVRIVTALDRVAGSSLRGRVVTYVFGAGSLVLYVASVAILGFERGRPGATIESFSDSIWWSFVTVTTVGYGDEYPVTGGGRFVAVLLMLSGIALIGVVTASAASWFIQHVSAEEASEAAMRRDLDALLVAVTELRNELEVARRTSSD